MSAPNARAAGASAPPRARTAAAPARSWKGSAEATPPPRRGTGLAFPKSPEQVLAGEIGPARPLRHAASGLVRLGHPADQRHHRQHPDQAEDDIGDGLDGLRRARDPALS